MFEGPGPVGDPPQALGCLPPKPRGAMIGPTPVPAGAKTLSAGSAGEGWQRTHPYIKGKEDIWVNTKVHSVRQRHQNSRVSQHPCLGGRPGARVSQELDTHMGLLLCVLVSVSQNGSIHGARPVWVPCLPPRPWHWLCTMQADKVSDPVRRLPPTPGIDPRHTGPDLHWAVPGRDP